MKMNIVIFHQMLCITRLKPTKTDGDTGFNSNHLINGTHRLYTTLCLLFNSMITNGYYPKGIGKINDYFNPQR